MFKKKVFFVLAWGIFDVGNQVNSENSGRQNCHSLAGLPTGVGSAAVPLID